MTTNPIFSLFVVLSAVTLVTVSMAAGVLAQTVLQPPKKPAVTSQDSNTSAAPAPIYLHELRVPAQTLKEAKQQHQGNFPPLDVPNEVPAPVSGLSVEQAQAQAQGQAQTQGQTVTPPVSTMRGGGMIQRAWDHASGTAGVKTLRLCGGCVYRVRVREFMVGMRLAMFIFGILMFFIALNKNRPDLFEISIIPSISIGCIGGCVDAALMRRVMVLKGITSFKEWCVRYLLPARWNKGATS